MLNHITIMGRLVRDPELRYTQSQTPVASFTLAVDRDFASRDGGERQTDFIDCVAWRQTGEFVSKYFTKGSMAVVAGRLQIRDWTDRDGNKRRTAEVVAENVYFGESKRREDGAAPARRDSYGGNSYGGNQGGYGNDRGNSYGGNQGGYGNDRGGYAGGNDRYGSNNGGYNSGYSRSASAFAELEDDDGDLPF